MCSFHHSSVFLSTSVCVSVCDTERESERAINEPIPFFSREKLVFQETEPPVVLVSKYVILD